MGKLLIETLKITFKTEIRKEIRGLGKTNRLAYASTGFKPTNHVKDFLTQIV